MEQQLVVFDLARESYGINIAAVESIIKMQTITQLPQAPYYVKGVTRRCRARHRAAGHRSALALWSGSPGS
jgi:hypothetical protein